MIIFAKNRDTDICQGPKKYHIIVIAMNDNGKQAALPRGTVLHGSTAYVIEDVLGIGGFGITYLATKEETWVNGSTMRRRVAVKEHFFSEYSERAADGTTVRTADTGRIRETVDGSLGDFLAEAKRLQTLADVNANIVKVFDVFRANGTAYYVMEYLEGISLGAAIAGRPLAEADMLAVMMPIVDTVAFLHSQRINHLDIKPDNIVLTEGGRRPVLIDFGQSKHFRTDGSSTSTVNVKGATAGFAPAEQYDGIRTFSPTADVYALGATMMACLTGKTPPRALTWQNFAKKRDIDTLPASPATKALIARALASDPSERYPDAGAMARGEENLPEIVDDNETKEIAQPAVNEVKPAGVFGVLRNDQNRIPHNLDLAVKNGGKNYYFSQSEWNALSNSQQAEYSKLGVVIDNDGQKFILGLYCVEGGRAMTWDEAMLYRYQMPTKEQGEAILSQFSKVMGAIRAFGGSDPRVWFWTKTEVNSYFAWIVAYDGGWFMCHSKKNFATGVRVVAPVERYPDAGAMACGEEKLPEIVDDNKTKELVPPTVDKVKPAIKPKVAITTEKKPRKRLRWVIIVAALMAIAAGVFGVLIYEQNRVGALNLHLAVEKHGQNYYFSQSEWNALSYSQQAEYSKLGVVIDKGGQCFILALNDEPGEYTWDEAMSRFGNHLPTKEQGEAWISQQDAVQRAVRAFGGNMPGRSTYDNNYSYCYCYWTRTEGSSSDAWHVNIYVGSVGKYGKTYATRVRVVAPVPVASAM